MHLLSHSGESTLILIAVLGFGTLCTTCAISIVLTDWAHRRHAAGGRLSQPHVRGGNEDDEVEVSKLSELPPLELSLRSIETASHLQQYLLLSERGGRPGRPPERLEALNRRHLEAQTTQLAEAARHQSLRTLVGETSFPAGWKAQRSSSGRFHVDGRTIVDYLLDIGGIMGQYLPVLRDITLYFADVLTDCLLMAQLAAVSQWALFGCYFNVLLVQLGLAYWTMLEHLRVRAEELSEELRPLEPHVRSAMGADAHHEIAVGGVERETPAALLEQRVQHHQWFRRFGFPLGVVAIDVLALMQPLTDLAIALLRRPSPCATSASSTDAARTVSWGGDCLASLRRLDDDQAHAVGWWWLRHCVSGSRVAELDQTLAQYAKVRCSLAVAFETLPNAVIGGLLFSFQRELGLQDITALWLSLLFSLATLTNELWRFRDELRASSHGSSAMQLLRSRVYTARSLPHDAFDRSKITSWCAPASLSGADLSWCLRPLREPSRARRLRVLDFRRLQSEAERVLLHELTPMLVHEYYQYMLGERQLAWTGRAHLERRCVRDLRLLHLPGGCAEGLRIDALRVSVGNEASVARAAELAAPSVAAALDYAVVSPQLSPEASPRLSPSPRLDPMVLDTRGFSLADAVVAGSLIGANPHILESYCAVQLGTKEGSEGSSGGGAGVLLWLAPLVERFKTIMSDRDKRDRSEGLALLANELAASHSAEASAKGGTRPAAGKQVTLEQLFRFETATKKAATVEGGAAGPWVLTHESLVLCCRILHPLHSGFIHAVPERTRDFLSDGFHRYEAAQGPRQARSARTATERALLLALLHNALEGAEKLRLKLEALLELTRLLDRAEAIASSCESEASLARSLRGGVLPTSQSLTAEIVDAEGRARGFTTGGPDPRSVLNDGNLKPVCGALNDVVRLLRSLELVEAERARGTLAAVGADGGRCLMEAIEEAARLGACDGAPGRWTAVRLHTAREHLARARACGAALGKAEELSVLMPLDEVDVAPLEAAIEEARRSGAEESELSPALLVLQQARGLQRVRRALLVVSDEAGGALTELPASKVDVDDLNVSINVCCGPGLAIDVAADPSGQAVLAWARERLEEARAVQHSLHSVRKAMREGGSADSINIAALKEAIYSAEGTRGMRGSDLATAREALSHATRLQPLLLTLKGLASPPPSEVDIGVLRDQLSVTQDAINAAGGEQAVRAAAQQLEAAQAALGHATRCQDAMASVRTLLASETGGEKVPMRIRVADLREAITNLAALVQGSGTVSRGANAHHSVDLVAAEALAAAETALEGARKAQASAARVEQLASAPPAEVDAVELEANINLAKKLGVEASDLRDAKDVLHRAKTLQAAIQHALQLATPPVSQVDCGKLEMSLQSALASAAALDEQADQTPRQKPAASIARRSAQLAALDAKLAPARARLSAAYVVQDGISRVEKLVRREDGAAKPLSEIRTEELRAACEKLQADLPAVGASDDSQAAATVRDATSVLASAGEMNRMLRHLRNLCSAQKPDTNALGQAIRAAEVQIPLLLRQASVTPTGDPAAEEALRVARIRKLVLEGEHHCLGKDAKDIDLSLLGSVLEQARKAGASADDVRKVQQFYHAGERAAGDRVIAALAEPPTWEPMSARHIRIEPQFHPFIFP